MYLQGSVSFIEADKGSLDCSGISAMALNDVAECKSASVNLGASKFDVFDTDAYPKNCFVKYVTNPPIKAFGFNRHPTGGTLGTVSPVCKFGALSKNKVQNQFKL